MMRFELQIALRFLREGRAQSALIVGGVMVGVAVVVFISALVTGLQSNTIRRTLGAQAHIVAKPVDPAVRPQRRDDHRVAMCFSLAAFAGVPVRILDPKCVAKTFPDYFETLFQVCTTPRERIPVICVDGPTASGKGTLSAEVAEQLGANPANCLVFEDTRIGIQAGKAAGMTTLLATCFTTWEAFSAPSSTSL